MRLSLCIATFNEEKNIHYPLDSAYDLVDEVIIVDGGSTDKTVEVAKSYGSKVKVFIENNPAMFHINKQKAIERARGEWILQLDADEALSQGLKTEIAQLLNIKNSEFRIQNSELNLKSRIINSKSNSEFMINNSKFAAYWFPRKNWFLGRFLLKGGVYPDYTIRLYKNGVAFFPSRDVHENVKVKGEVGYLKNPILHYADPNLSRYLKRWNRYNNLEVQNSEFRIKNEKKNRILMFFEYVFWKPFFTFFSMYFRHLGFMDGWQGFVFAVFSSIRFWAIYVKWIRKS